MSEIHLRALLDYKMPFEDIVIEYLKPIEKIDRGKDLYMRKTLAILLILLALGTLIVPARSPILPIIVCICIGCIGSSVVLLVADSKWPIKRLSSNRKDAPKNI